MNASLIEIAVASVATATWVLALLWWCRAGEVVACDTTGEDPGLSERAIRVVAGMATGGAGRTVAVLGLVLVVMLGLKAVVLVIAAVVAVAAHRLHTALLAGSWWPATAAEASAGLWTVILLWK